MTARYWIAQYIEDVFRNEPKNVGVFVETKGQIAARFIGEDESGTIDGRRLRSFAFPDVYRQWVEYWRYQCKNAAFDEVLKSSGSNYRISSGGEVSDIESDSASAVSNYLYSLLVSEGGFEEAISETTEEYQPPVVFHDEVSDALAEGQLLATPSQTIATVPHPVRRGVEVLGQALAVYRPAFVQENGHLYVMETVDFTRGQKKASRDHAGWSAYMFHDVKARRTDSESIALVRVTDSVKDSPDVQNGLALLKNESRVINWEVESERRGFLEERRQVAFGN